jgi:hypothetical protein
MSIVPLGRAIFADTPGTPLRFLPGQVQSPLRGKGNSDTIATEPLEILNSNFSKPKSLAAETPSCFVRESTNKKAGRKRPVLHRRSIEERREARDGFDCLRSAAGGGCRDCRLQIPKDARGLGLA